ncbi:hypothetical protein FSP39_009039 [Pinctada imbricata]|uniref:Ig-like domain-containing protein n=1 Tax=Pinctada imbricata TaxID=66713 RepID=A0AA88Y1W9_PINIB|nr:hypothetical protein FSP39_009039 [Pinctada imbricata]
MNILLILLTISSFEVHSATDLEDFGFNLLKLKRKWVKNHLEITAEIEAPNDAEFLWSFGFDRFPVLGNDRFSSVESLQRNGKLTTRLHTTLVNEGFINLKVWTFTSYYKAFEIIIRNKKENVVRRYTNRCKYSAPKHLRNRDDSTIQVKFDCGIYKGQDLSNISTGVFYRAEAMSKSGLKGRYIDSWVSKDRESFISGRKSYVTKTVKQNNTWIDDQGGILGMFKMIQPASYRDKGPLFSMRHIIEDDKSFDGRRDNPFLPGVFSNVYFTVNTATLLASRRQAYIYCRAIGYKIPGVQVYKQTENGSLVTLSHPKIVLDTKFSRSLHYVINYPTAEDAGSYVCVATVDGQEQRFNVTTYFEPPLSPEIIEEESGRVFRYYEENIKLKVKVPEDLNMTCYIGSKFGKKIDSKSLRFTKRQKDLTLIIDFYVKWPKPWEWSSNQRKNVFCQAKNIYGEDWIKINEKRRLPKIS